MTFMTFHSVGNVIIPTDEHQIFFRGVGSTTNQFIYIPLYIYTHIFQWFSQRTKNLHGEEVPFGLAVVDLGSSNETFGDLNRR